MSSEYHSIMEPADLAEAIQEMILSPAWRAYHAKLIRIEADQVRSLRQAQTWEQTTRLQGALGAMETVRDMPQVLIAELTAAAKSAK